MKTILALYRSTFRFDALLTEWGGSLMSLALRLYVGWVFFKSGLTKIADWDSTVQLFTDEYQTPLLSPEVAAVMGAAGELALPLLLFVGLLSRPAALGLFMVNLMSCGNSIARPRSTTTSIGASCCWCWWYSAQAGLRWTR
jgi:putative oxidoreductase